MARNPGARKKQSQANAKDKYLGMAATALSQDPIIYLEGYCDWPDCPVREVDVHVKDYDKTLLGRWQQRAPGCPLCKRALKIHNVVTRNQRDEREEEDARFSVNCQVYTRDHPEELGLPIMEIGYDLPPRVDAWNG